MRLAVKRIGTHTLPLPAYAKPGDAGMDLRACFELGDSTKYLHKCGFHDDGMVRYVWRLQPGDRCVIRCGFAFEIPQGHVGLIQDRSSMAAKGIKVAGGVIDASFRGEPSIVLVNVSRDDVEIGDGDRVAQMLILPCPQAEIIEATELSATERGANGFGSTGAK